MLSRRLFLVIVFLILGGCRSVTPVQEQLTIGVVSFGQSQRSVDQYTDFKTYIEQQLQSLVELEPTYNEIKAVDEIERKRWDMVFAPAGLAAIAISQFQYTPLFPLEGTLENRSVIIVLEDSPLTNIRQLEGKTLALGQIGSATGYYLPIYNLYGLTLAEINFAATPKIILDEIAQKKVDAGAMSLAEFNRYRADFPKTSFRVLYTDSHPVPSGAVLVSPDLTPERKEKIQKVLTNASPALASSAGYITNAPPPKYDYLIEVVGRVRQISERIKQKPAPLYEGN